MIPSPNDAFADATHCETCGRDACEDHLPTTPTSAGGLDPAYLMDAADVAREGQRIATEGIRYAVDGLIPNYGMLGLLVAYAKVGKTTLGHALAAAVAMDRSFLDRPVTRARLLVLAAEDPPEYTAWLARHLVVDPGAMTFYRAPLVLNATGLDAICQTVAADRYGLVLIATWQAVVRGLVRDENDNAGNAAVMEHVKLEGARRSGVPWLIDAHSGKGEDQSDDADPSRAMRGASALAGSADYSLSLRYANGTFGTQRRLSGKGRFVSFAPLTLDFDAATSRYELIGTAKDVMRETTWRLICETGALDSSPRSATEIARAAGLVSADGDRLGGAARQKVYDAVRGRADVLTTQEMRRGQKTTLFSQVRA